MLSRQLIAVCVLLCGGTLIVAQESTNQTKLAFSAGPDGTFTFDTGTLRGRVHSDGRGFGLNGVEQGTEGQSLSSAVGLLNVYRVFSNGTRYGNAGWEWPNQAELGADGAVTVKCAAAPDRPFALQGTYRCVTPSRVDLELLVTPVEDLKDFEVFVASYFDKAFTQSAAFVNENPQAAGKPGFMSAKQELGNWLMFPRDQRAVTLIQDGRWQLPPNPVDWVILPSFWKPLAMRRIPERRLTALLMADSAETFAIAMPFETEGHYSVYFSLFGRDLKAGEQAQARVRLEVLTTPDDATEAATEAYRAFDVSSAQAVPPQADAARPRTVVTIQENQFLINGKPTYAGRVWNGKPVEGLLLNARMVQGIFDDLNPETVGRWAYPDTGRWDPERNTNEFLAAMPSWRAHGLTAFTINLQGGSPQGYSQSQPWINSAIAPDGSLREPYMTRLARIIDAAEQLQMVVILGYFYFGQDQHLQDEAAVLRATDNATRWILEHGWRHVLVEINNECNVRYEHAILTPPRVHELIERVKQTPGDGYRLLVSTSYGGGTIPEENVVRTADYLLLHGNGISEPDKIARMVQRTRQVPGYTPKPILFNEDDHFDFDKPQNNFTAAIGEYAGWGYFDFRKAGESFQDGYQSVPVDWSISSPRKRGFFQLLSEISGESPAFRPGQVWLDTEGRPIQAHGGCVLYHDGTYYWYGENKDGPTLNNNRVDIIGISCYSSRDLYRWKFEGLALKAVPDDAQHDLHPSRVCERPKVVFNEKTGKFVMWIHIDDAKYQYARTGVAIADQPTGPFQYIESFRPNGGESRDMTVFKDDDGKAYVIFGSGWHTHVQIAELTDDYLKPSGKFSNHFQRPGPPTGREAPAVFKHAGRYYMITSGTTGWACNEALYAVADSMHGPWTEMGNPCVGPEADKTFRAQSTFVLPIVGKNNAFLFMGDRWNSEDLRDSRYVWLPIEFTEEGIRLTWRDSWDLSVFDPAP